ncbi:MAG: phage major tail tube protein [Alphaproteobacteria bacterium]|nr:MAG: phage major tail tube protein [Alphaproteobacteria bacterium]
MLPRKLKQYHVFSDAQSYLGEAKEVALSKIAAKMEEYRGGGMLGPVKVDMGLEGLEIEVTYGGLVVGILRQMGMVRHDGVLLRFNGAYQSDDTGGVTAAELIVRGRHEEIDPGNAKAGEDTEWKVKSTLSYLKWTIGGRVEVEIDLVNCIYIVGGVDRMAEIRAAIGVDSSPLASLISGPNVQVPGLGGFGLDL